MNDRLNLQWSPADGCWRNAKTDSKAELARLMIENHPGIAQAAGGCPCAILPVLPEILAAAAVVIRSRRVHPTPGRTVVSPDGSETPLKAQ